jgi:hypothetical protein
MVREGRKMKELFGSSTINKYSSTCENKKEFDLNNYKGMFYESVDEKKYFEAGAHFSYIELYKRLKKLELNNHQANQKKKLQKENKDGKINLNLR